jgi:hypothetical protein
MECLVAPQPSNLFYFALRWSTLVYVGLLHSTADHFAPLEPTYYAHLRPCQAKTVCFKKIVEDFLRTTAPSKSTPQIVCDKPEEFYILWCRSRDTRTFRNEFHVACELMPSGDQLGTNASPFRLPFAPAGSTGTPACASEARRGRPPWPSHAPIFFRSKPCYPFWVPSSRFKEPPMEWITPQHEEIDLNCEISSYANAEL